MGEDSVPWSCPAWLRRIGFSTMLTSSSFPVWAEGSDWLLWDYLSFLYQLTLCLSLRSYPFALHHTTTAGT